MAHGISKPPSLRGGNELATRHNRLSKQMDSYDKGCFASLQSKGWWAGAHTIAEAAPFAWREYKNKGVTYWRPLHRCSKCKRLVSRSELTSSPCPEADAPLAPKVASKIWKECRAAASASLVQERKARLKGISNKEACRRARAARWGTVWTPFLLLRAAQLRSLD